MINLSKSGNTIVFEFVNNGHYLQNGTIEVPVNSLTLVTDGSDMFTFKKSATNDIFVSGLYSEIGMTKSELETFYKENMATGGSGGVTSGEVQSMIDESISGKADTSAFTTYTASTDSRIAEYEEVTAAALNALNEEISGKVETSAITSAVTSASTDNEIPTAKAVYDAIPTGGGATYSAGTGINIDSANTITAVYKGWHGERVYNLDNISTPFYMHKADDCGWRSSFDVFFEINGAQSQVNFDVLTHTYTFIEGDSSWNDYVDVEWDNTYECFKATPNTQINVSDASCARFSRLQYVGATENAIDNAFDEIESINNSAIGNIEFGARDSDNVLYIYPSSLSVSGLFQRSVSLSGGVKSIDGKISTQMQSTPYQWYSASTSSSSADFNIPTTAVTFDISRNPTDTLSLVNTTTWETTMLYENGEWLTGNTTVSGNSVSAYTSFGLIVNTLFDNSSELDQYVSNVKYWACETDTIPNVVTNINEKFDGLRLKKLTQNEYDALVSGGTVDNNTLYVIS